MIFQEDLASVRVPFIAQKQLRNSIYRLCKAVLNDWKARWSWLLPEQITIAFKKLKNPTSCSNSPGEGLRKHFQRAHHTKCYEHWKPVSTLTQNQCKPRRAIWWSNTKIKLIQASEGAQSWERSFPLTWAGLRSMSVIMFLLLTCDFGDSYLKASWTKITLCIIKPF